MLEGIVSACKSDTCGSPNPRCPHTRMAGSSAGSWPNHYGTPILGCPHPTPWLGQTRTVGEGVVSDPRHVRGHVTRCIEPGQSEKASIPVLITLSGIVRPASLTRPRSRDALVDARLRPQKRRAATHGTDDAIQDTDSDTRMLRHDPASRRRDSLPRHRHVRSGPEGVTAHSTTGPGLESCGVVISVSDVHL
jgi:hypothetical protein